MSEDKLSAIEAELEFAAPRRQLLYFWSLKAEGIEIDDDEILKLERQVYSNLCEFDGKGELPLSQRDVDELQLLLSTVEPQPNKPNLKATLFRLHHTTLKMGQDKNHQRPHFHIEYKTQYRASYAVDTFERLAGNMPTKFEKPILEWAQKHQQKLKYTWEKLQAGQSIQELIAPPYDD